MAHVKRPSKSIIVNKSLEYINESMMRERYLAKENLDLRREVDELRQRLGMPTLPPPPPHIVSALTHSQQVQPRSPNLTGAIIAPSPPIIVPGQIAVPTPSGGVSAAEFAAAVQAQNQAAVQAGYGRQIPTLLAQRGQNIHFGIPAGPGLFHDPAHGLTTAALLSPAGFHPHPQGHPFENPAAAQLYSATGQLFGAGPMLSAPAQSAAHGNSFDASFAGVHIKSESDDEKSKEMKKPPSTSGSESLKSPNTSSTPESASFISASPPVSVAQQQQQIAASLGIDFAAANHAGLWAVKPQNGDDVLASSVSSEGSRRGSIAQQAQPNWYNMSLDANNSAYGLFA
ncbi:hypothetical protein BT69DRAFT_1295564 [Atractiella rhizophila]|nr:hypothetical protein BT69DRAFT_1295564 [Atractiella rhizophila]